jgi:hypothetical protein
MRGSRVRSPPRSPANRLTPATTRAWLEPDDTRLAVHLMPLECQDFAWDAPAGVIGKLTACASGGLSLARTPSNCARSKNPVRTLSYFSIGTCGRWSTFPACIASV